MTTLGTLDWITLRNLGIALFIGALVGQERERKSGKRFGGIRTFMLIALAGAATAWIAEALDSAWVAAAGILSVAGLLGAAYHATEKYGLTGEMAALLVYLLGAMCVLGSPEVAVVLAVAASALLTFKTPLHSLVNAMAPEDVSAMLKLAFATFVVLPVLPNEPVDPWGVLNPFRLWGLVILISGLSLLGYVAVRFLGERRGQALTGLFGGLVSSTAVTLSAARQAAAATATADALAMSVLLAWAVMFVRVPIEVAVVESSLLPAVLPSMVAMGVATGAAAGLFALRDSGGKADDIELRNPFSLWEAIKFGLLFAAVLVAVEFGDRLLDDSALYGIAALAGTTDVDAITLSMAELAKRDETSTGVAVRAIVIASVSNTVVKAGIAGWLGGKALGARIALAAVAIGAAGGIAAALTPGL